MNYQYRFGTTTSQAIRILYADGGWTRYYQGLSAAIVQAPVARFGDTAANAGILAFLRSNPYMRKLPVWIQTAFASLTASAFRIVLMPIDTVKTTLQAQGRRGLPILRARVRSPFIGCLRGESNGHRIRNPISPDQDLWYHYIVVRCASNCCCDICWALSSKLGHVDIFRILCS